jgi:polar amino acid transport system substrate-binding protein
MAITTARQQVLEFSVPYYYTPAQFAAAASSGVTSLEQLAGQTICVGTATTYGFWLEGEMDDLGLPPTSIHAQPPANVTVVSLSADQECPQAIAAGRTDFVAYLTSRTVVDQNIAAGIPVVRVGEPVFTEDLAVALDRQSPIPIAPLLARINEIVTEMHTDGTLTRLSLQFFGTDLTQSPHPATAQ